MADNRGMPTSSETSVTAPESRCAPRVVLADDDVLLREGLASLLDRSGFDVVGQAGNGTELLTLVRSAQPELAIIDIRMPPTHATEGLQAARVIREELPGTAIIVLSAHVEVEEAMDLLAGGERTVYISDLVAAAQDHPVPAVPEGDAPGLGRNRRGSSA